MTISYFDPTPFYCDILAPAVARVIPGLLVGTQYSIRHLQRMLTDYADLSSIMTPRFFKDRLYTCFMLNGLRLKTTFFRPSVFHGLSSRYCIAVNKIMNHM